MAATDTAMLICLAAAMCASTSALHSDTARKTLEFEKYMTDFGRGYASGTDEYAQRRSIFEQRLLQIKAHNSRPDRRWTAGLNSLTDSTDNEWEQLRGWRRGPRAGGSGGGAGGFGGSFLQTEAYSYDDLATEVSWKNLAMAKDVPNQGGCGSCWALATVSMLQANAEIMQSINRTFSAQQLVNCVPNPKSCGGTGGCDGATVELAMHYVGSAGLQDNLQEPYGGRDMHCMQPMSEPHASSMLELAASPNVELHTDIGHGSSIGLHSWRTLPENKAEPLMRAVQTGPVAISVGAGDWLMYGGGVFDGCQKDVVIDHAVTLFGYGEENGEKYWTVRNSWGTGWGEQGFIRLLRQAPEQEDAYCGTDNDPKAGIACKPYPDKVKVCGMCGLLYDSVAVNLKPLSGQGSSMVQQRSHAPQNGAQTERQSLRREAPAADGFLSPGAPFAQPAAM